MIDFFYQGGVLFMSLISITLILSLVSFYTHSENLKTYGSLGLAFGIFGTIIGIYDAFSAIEEIGNISQSMLAGGLKVSLTTTLYGFLVYLLTRILSLVR